VRTQWFVYFPRCLLSKCAVYHLHSMVISVCIYTLTDDETDTGLSTDDSDGCCLLAASPEPHDVSSSPTDFGNFVGVESLTLTSTEPTSSAADLTGLDSSVPTTSANKLATKDDIMALYGPSNNSSLCSMPPGNFLLGLYCRHYSPVFCSVSLMCIFQTSVCAAFSFSALILLF